jgi:hypothetical protein
VSTISFNLQGSLTRDFRPQDFSRISFPLGPECPIHKVLIYIEHHSVCPFVGIGTPHPFSRKRVCPPPRTKGWGAHSPAAKGVGESQFQRLEKRLALCLLCGPIGQFQIITKSLGDICNCSPVSTTPPVYYRWCRCYRRLSLVPDFHRFHDTSDSLVADNTDNGDNYRQ